MLRIVFGLMISALLASTPATAQDLKIDDLVGRWCGESSNYIFTRSALTVKFFDGRRDVVWKIDRVETSPDWINVIWKPPRGNTVFTEFSKDRNSMAQAQNTSGDMGPRRPYRRC